jgi:[acyl-carrier-protein] S-malonyltransferase
MSALAFLFPGQGAQRPGMGSALRDSDPDVLAAHFARASAASGLPIEQFCADGPAAELLRTEVAQPALFAVSLALADVARTVGLRPQAVAGHSLGEYTAAVAAGALEPEEGVALVARRGRLMARVQRERPGAMAAIVGPAPETVAALCAAAEGSGALAVANFNTPCQTVVSGDVGAIDRLLALVRQQRAGRGVRLPVGAAFHSALMRPVRDELSGVVTGLGWRDLEVPLAANTSGALVQSAAVVREALVAQVTEPVRWVACVRALLDAGCRHFLELGPGRVLSGLVRQIAPGADVAAADSRAAIEAYVATRRHLLTG